MTPKREILIKPSDDELKDPELDSDNAQDEMPDKLESQVVREKMIDLDDF
jgi:hypothetical protein